MDYTTFKGTLLIMGFTIQETSGDKAFIARMATPRISVWVIGDWTKTISGDNLKPFMASVYLKGSTMQHDLMYNDAIKVIEGHLK